MVVPGSLRLSSILGFCDNQNHSKQFKIVTGRGNQHYLAIGLSSCDSRQDIWSHRLSTSFNRPLCSLPCRCSLLKCNSFLSFDPNVTVTAAKAATAALTRLYNAFQGSPLLTTLVPPAGVVFFALWGLQPLMQLSRQIFLHKSESSWKKSTANYVMTSYLQPILLWTSAILICRSLDPIAMPTESSQLVKQRLLSFVKSLSTVLAFAFCLSSGIQQTQKYFMETSSASDSSNMGFQFAGKAVYSAVWVAAVSLFMELLGFSTQKWLTAGGLGTVLLTLAGREIFTNFLSSIMIHATRPFVLNEWIQTKIEGYEVSGTVEHVGWWSPTIIRGEDREAVHIPNHKFTVNVVRNLTQKSHWRVKTHLAISHLDASKINNIVADMRKVLAKNPQIEQQKLHRRVFLENVDPETQALRILISCFVKTSHHEEFFCVQEGILMDLLRVIKHHRARLATPIRTIQKFYNEPDLGNMSFSDSLFTRGGPASKTPVLLIDTPYKINGEDKSKSQARTVRTSDVIDNQGTEQLIADTTTDSKDGESATPDANNTKEMSKPGNKAEVAETSNLNTSDENRTSVASKFDQKPDDISNAVKSTSIPKPSIEKNADSKDVGSSTSDAHTKETSTRSNKTEVKVAEPSSSKASDVSKASVSSKLYHISDDEADAVNTEKENTEIRANYEKTDIPAEGSQSKLADKSPTPESSKSTSPALEDNIVLGVALEGSKRTLPIEDDLPSSLTPQEAKEVAKRNQGNVDLPLEKDENEN